MRKHWGTPSRRDRHVTLAAISPPDVARGRFPGGHQSGLAESKPPPLFTRGISYCSSQGRRRGEPWGASPRPSAPTYLPFGRQIHFFLLTPVVIEVPEVRQTSRSTHGLGSTGRNLADLPDTPVISGQEKTENEINDAPTHTCLHDITSVLPFLQALALCCCVPVLLPSTVRYGIPATEQQPAKCGSPAQLASGSGYPVPIGRGFPMLGITA